MKIKKLMALLLAAAMGMGAVGCSKTQSDNGSEFADAEENAVITFYYPGGLPPADSDLVNEKLSEYTMEKINAKVKFERFDWNSYDQKVSSSIASGESFDLLFTCDWAAPYLQYAQKGAYMELDELLEQYGQDILKAIAPEMFDAVRVNGSIYTVPVNKEHAHSVGFLFRKDLIEKYGIDVSTIKDLDTLDAALAIAKEKDPDKYPLGVGKEGLTQLLDFDTITGSSSAPGALYSKVGETEVVNQYATEEYMNLSKKVREFYQKGYIRPDVATKSTSSSTADEFAQVASLKPGKDKESAGEFEYIQVEFTSPVFRTADATGAMAAISHTCKNPVSAMKVLNLMYSDSTFLDMLYYGIEGKHYNVTEDGRIKQVVDSGYMTTTQWMFGNQYIAKIKDTEDVDKWDKIKKFNEEAVVLDSIGFVFDQTAVKTEMGACANVIAEYGFLINCGVSDPETTVPEFLKKLNDSGAQTIIDEVQKQYDEFLKSKK